MLAVQFFVPLAAPPPPTSFTQVTWVTPAVSEAVPFRVRGVVLVLYVALDVGAVMDTLGGVVSGGEKVTVRVSVAVLPAASRAVTVSTFDPAWRAMPLAVQDVVPEAVPLPPRLFVQVTWVTPTLSEAVPPRVRGLVLVLYVELDVGAVMETLGAVLSGGE